jgi:arginase family enzyme
VFAVELTNEEVFATTVSNLAERADTVHVHIDLDVIDLSDGRANEFASQGGPSLDALGTAIGAIADRCRINSVSLTSYNPSVDEDGSALEASMRLLRTLGQACTTLTRTSRRIPGGRSRRHAGTPDEI